MLCRVGERCARTRRSRDRPAACLARCPNAGEARSAAATRTHMWTSGNRGREPQALIVPRSGRCRPAVGIMRGCLMRRCCVGRQGGRINPSPGLCSGDTDGVRASQFHMWTAPSSQGVLQCFDQIACVHMSGLLVRSHMSAGQDGFRDTGSKQHGGLMEGHWN